MEMILKTANLCKSFSGQTVVNNISLNIERNSVYGLLGPNGAGKSTTLKMITGAKGITVILSSHILSEVQQTADHIGIISGNSSIFCFTKHCRKYRDYPCVCLAISLCLYLARKTGLFLPIVLNTVLGIFMPIALGNTVVWWLVPYCYAAKLAEPLMGIELNGTFEGNCGFSITVLISIVLSILLFLILSYADAKDFSKRR